MIFFSSSQLYSFCLVALCGIIFGIFYIICGVILLKNHQNKIFDFIFKFILSLIFSVFLIFSINIFYFGQFNPIIICAFFVGFVWCIKTLNKTLDFFEIKFYHIYINCHRWLKLYLEGKRESIKD